MYYHLFLYYPDLFFRFYLFLVREEGMEREMERNIKMLKVFLQFYFRGSILQTHFFLFSLYYIYRQIGSFFPRIYTSVFLNFLTNKRHLF